MKFKFASVAAAMLATTSANAADLGRGAPAAVDYVKVCDAYGTGFFYIPGTETCLKIGGYVRADMRTGDADKIYNRDVGIDRVYAGPLGESDGNRARNQFHSLARFDLQIDARTATEFGLLRSMAEALFTVESGSSSPSVGLDQAFIQWGGLTAGRAQSFFDFFTGYAFNNIGIAVSDQKVNLLAYTLSFGNGITASLSIEDPSTSGDGRLGNPTVNALVAGDAVRYGGLRNPDVVGNLNIRQAWGAAQLMAAAHHVYSNVASGGLGGGAKWGWAAGAGIEVNLPMLGAGDKIALQAAWSKGALRYVSGSSLANSGFVNTAAGPNYGLGVDAVATATGMNLVKAWGIAGGFKHNFSPAYEMNINASYHDVDGDGGPFGAVTAERDYNQLDVGVDFRWKPASGLMVGVGLDYRAVDFSAATIAEIKGDVKKDPRDGNAWLGTLRVQRSF